MKFHVSSGSYECEIDRETPYQAALNAIGFWHCKSEKPKLSPLTTVSDGVRNIEISTDQLAIDNGFELIEEQSDGKEV